MGSILENTAKSNGLRHTKRPSKGQRLGWVHKSVYEQEPVCALSSRGEKLITYTTGPFSTNKLIP